MRWVGGWLDIVVCIFLGGKYIGVLFFFSFLFSKLHNIKQFVSTIHTFAL
jgi:hypothetical protein